MMAKLHIKRTLLVESAVVTITLFSLTVGTFAWFAVANSVGVETFRISYGEADKIQFGLIVPPDETGLGTPGDVNFFDNLTETDLINYRYYDAQSHLSPVSSMFQTRWLNETTNLADENLFPVLRDTYISYDNTTDSKVATTGFFQFEFFLKSNMDMYLYLDSSASALPNTSVNAVRSPGFSSELNQISECLRVSFLSSLGFNIWEPNTSVAGSTAFAGRIDVLTPDGFYDFAGAPTDYHEIMFGEINDPDKIIYSEAQRAHAEGLLSSFNASTADDVAPLDFDASISNGLIVTHEDSKTTATLADQTLSSSALAYLPEYTPTRIVVSVYAEGWDLDTTDMIRNAGFILNLTLTGRYRAPNEPIFAK